MRERREHDANSANPGGADGAQGIVIQEIPAAPADPLGTFKDDYGKAVLHLAWDRMGGGAECTRTLLFAFVELLPREVPAPVDDYDPDAGIRLGCKSKHKIHFRHAVASAQQALAWYLDCRKGLIILPENDGTLPSSTGGAKRLDTETLDDVLPWPTLRTAGGGDGTIPFCPQWIESPRVHHLLPLREPAIKQIWSEREAEKAGEAIRDHLHFNIGAYQEYWGSVHLIAPNPAYRRMDVRLQPRVPPAESVLVRFEPRAGKSVEGLSLLFEEQAPWGKSLIRFESVRSKLVRINFDRTVNMVREEVIDPERGMLRVQDDSAAFLRRFGLDVRLGSTLRVSGPEPGDGYEVTRSSKADGKAEEKGASETTAWTRMHEAYSRRRAAAHASEHGQHWFRGNREEARAYVRGLLHRAMRRVLVVDAYTGAEELFTYLLAVGAEDVTIQVLTSAELLTKSQSATEITKTKADVLTSNLGVLRGTTRMNPFEVRVMTGSRPDIHDRFLLLDDKLWLLGSSLNEFGARGTMLVSVPDPEPVVREVLAVWDVAPLFDDWYQRRQNLVGPGPNAGGQP
jgi:hypothetical protein